MDGVDEKQLLVEIAESCGDLIEEKGDFILYVQANESLMAASIYHDRGDALVYIEPDDELIDLIEDYRQMLPPEERWSLMNLVMHGVRSAITFEYGGQGVEFGSTDRSDPRHIAARAALGDKPIEYPGQGPEEGKTVPDD